jgi:hypothetical protein
MKWYHIAYILEIIGRGVVSTIILLTVLAGCAQVLPPVVAIVAASAVSAPILAYLAIALHEL